MRVLGHCDKPFWEEWGSFSLPRLTLGDDKDGEQLASQVPRQTLRQDANHSGAVLPTQRFPVWPRAAGWDGVKGCWAWGSRQL